MLQLVTYLTGTSQQTIPIYVLSLQYYSSSVIALIFCRHFSAYFDVFIYSYFIGSAPMLFHFYFITSQPTIRSLPAAHHGEVCDLSKSFLICPSSVGNYRSLCFVYKFFRNVYFFFMGSDPNVGIQIVSLINTKNRLGDYTMPWLHLSLIHISEPTRP